ncbi:MAG: hypothetical protein FWC17_02285 [Treponema sp.]|nr:hypothetical protein [Treponema sp.]
MEKIIQIIRGWFQKLSAVQKKRFVIICTAVFAGILVFSVLMTMRRPPAEDVPQAPGRISIHSPIPVEELFLPDEPDFIPGVLLERDRRQSWTEDDVAEFWQDPLRFGEEQWRVSIESAADEILERVP